VRTGAASYHRGTAVCRLYFLGSCREPTTHLSYGNREFPRPFVARSFSITLALFAAMDSDCFLKKSFLELRYKAKKSIRP
jgi:hypothetical protein